MITRKRISYWPSWTDALKYAEAHNLPTNRIINYQLGYAIQRYISGPYWSAKTESWD